MEYWVTETHLPVVARYVLAFVFCVAAVSKLLSQEPLEKAVDEYKILPPYLVPIFATLLPAIELTVSVALALGMGIRPASVATLVLLISFAVAVGVNIIRGRDLDCHCFGSWFQDKVDWFTLLRILVLTALAAIVFVAPERSLGAGEQLILMIFGATAVVIAALLNRAVRLALRIGWPGGLPVGDVAPPFTGETIKGLLINLNDYLGKRLLLIFGFPRCNLCHRLVPRLNAFLRDHHGQVEALFLSHGSRMETLEFVLQSGISCPVITVEGEGLMDLYDVHSRPFAFLLDEGAVIRAKGLAYNEFHLDDLWRRAFAHKGPGEFYE